MIGSIRQTCADARFDADPPGIDVHHAKQLVRLLRSWQKVADASEVVIFLAGGLFIVDPTFLLSSRFVVGSACGRR
jgi:hypothetical protein